MQIELIHSLKIVRLNCLLHFAVLSDGYFGTEEVECASTRAEPGAWWMVDTGRIHRISHVAVTTVRDPDGNLYVYYIHYSKIKHRIK